MLISVYSMSIEGLIAAQNIGKIGDEVTKLTEKARKILTGIASAIMSF